jgi:DNA-binding transcriptional LysR family regulator
MPALGEPVSETYWTKLRVFLQVAPARSLNKAAQQLGMCHPTVGRAVRRLEKTLRTPLLASSRARGVKLTQRGEQLARTLNSHYLLSVRRHPPASLTVRLAMRSPRG